MIDELIRLYPYYSFLIECAVLSLVLLALPYLFYPKLIDFIYSLSNPTKNDYESIKSWPTVDIVFAAFNEESVIREKINSILELDYPREKLKIRVGSDCSTDSTDIILAELSKYNESLEFVRMENRTGKSNIINQLVTIGDSQIIVGTDANIFFKKDALKELVGPLLSDSKIDLVGGNLVYRGMENIDKNSISKDEELYINWENKLKQKEGELWGCTMGVEGGCYAIRREAFIKIPNGTLMEDFFHTMNVLKSGKKVIHSSSATCSEDVSNNSSMEFRRKIRISQGNWQNLSRFFSMVFTHTVPIGMVFLGHKILRWLSPVLFIIGLVVNVAFRLSAGNYTLVAISLGELLMISTVVLYPTKILPAVFSSRLKSLSYFAWMNIALFLGLIRYLRTKETGIWQPTTRNNK